MKSMTKFLVVMLLIISGPLLSADLTSAKKAGLIGEQANGYIGMVKKVPSDIKELVLSVNEKRKARYKKIAKNKKLSLKKIELIGGKKAMEKTKKGNLIKKTGEGWKKK